MVRTNLPCPYCDQATIEVIRFAWYQRGTFPILLPRFGRRELLGCRRCVRRAALTELGWNAVLGWFCFTLPLNPVFLIQNLLTLVSPDWNARAKLEHAFDQAGISLADHEIGGDGLTPIDRATVARLVVLLAGAMDADGDAGPEEMSRAVAILAGATGGALTDARAREMLTAPLPNDQSLTSASWDERVSLIHVAASVLTADNLVTPQERDFLRDLGQRLALPAAYVQDVLTRFEEGDIDREDDEDARAARLILNLDSRATLPEIKRQYRERMVRLRAGSGADAIEDASRLDWAYGVLRSRALAGVGSADDATPPRSTASPAVSDSVGAAPTDTGASLPSTTAVTTTPTALSLPGTSGWSSLPRMRKSASTLCVAAIPAAVAMMFVSAFYDSQGGFVLGILLLLSVPFWALLVMRALFQRRPRLVVLLRPFGEAAVSDALRRLVRNEVSYLGITFTLADQYVAPSDRDRRKVFDAIASYNPLALLIPPVRYYSVHTRKELQQFQKLPRQTWRLTWQWVLSHGRLFPVVCADAFWQDAIQTLLTSADCIVMDLSEAGPGSVWELRQLQADAHVNKLIFAVTEESERVARELIAAFVPGYAHDVIVYGSTGKLVTPAVSRSQAQASA